MKFSCMILICLLIIATVMAMELRATTAEAARCLQWAYYNPTHTTFETCDPEEWVVTNTTLKWKDNTKIITCDIFYEKINDRAIHRVQIEIDDCKNHTACTGKPKVSVDNINCNNQDLSESELNICRIVNDLGNWEKQEKLLQHRYGIMNKDMLHKLIFCLNFEHTDFSWSNKGSDESNLNESK